MAPSTATIPASAGATPEVTGVQYALREGPVARYCCGYWRKFRCNAMVNLMNRSAERGTMGDSAAADGPDLMVTYDGRTSIRHAADGAFIIGRDQRPSALSVEHFAVSRVHARLIPGEKQWWLVDYESRNGIYVDGVRVRRSTPVVDGMTVHLANPKGIAITFHYVHPEDITAPAAAGPPAADAPAPRGTQAEEPELTRYQHATAQLQDVIKDVMAVPAPGHPRAARTMLRLLQQLGQLRLEFAAVAVDEDMAEARALLTCVEAMYHGLAIRMSVCA